MKKVLTVVIGILFICGMAGSTALAGKYNQSVYDSQCRLKERGYTPGPADGLMGAKTADAIRKFQKDQGLPPTGNLDEQTVKLLSGQPSGAKTPQDAKPHEPSKNDVKTTSKRTGDANRVLKVQQYLQQLGYKPGPPDGMAGKKTTDAVKRFQQDRGLTVTGVINDLILKEMEALIGSKNEPKPQTPGGQKPKDRH